MEILPSSHAHRVLCKLFYHEQQGTCGGLPSSASLQPLLVPMEGWEMLSPCSVCVRRELWGARLVDPSQHITESLR